MAKKKEVEIPAAEPPVVEIEAEAPVAVEAAAPVVVEPPEIVAVPYLELRAFAGQCLSELDHARRENPSSYITRRLPELYAEFAKFPEA